MIATLETLLAAAVRAPSGDNTQPWRFVIDTAAGRIAFHMDETRDPSPMNSGQRMSRIAVGAALENLLQTANLNGWTAELEENPAALALVRLAGMERMGEQTASAITVRVTNRRLYDSRPVLDDALQRLRNQTPVLNGVSTLWIVDRDRVAKLADLIGRSDATMFGEPSMRRAFLSKVRFDAPAEAEVEEGLSLASLELSAADRVAMRLMTRLPNWLLKYGGAMRVFAAKARAAVTSASGLCLQLAPDGALQTDLHVGRTMQRAWLALAGEGMAAQPMMTLPVLENALEHGSDALLASLGRGKIMALREEFRALVPEIGDGRPAFLLRFGFAPAPSGRTGRLPVAAVCIKTPPARTVSGAIKS